MNMISTGAFQTEMDASRKNETLVKKLVSAWEKKNAKVARAGGVSLMALSLAACGSSDDDSTSTATDTSSDTTTVVTPTVDAAVNTAMTNVQDTISGGSGDDTFSGIVQAAGALGTTAFPGDIVNGGAGNDTLTISVAGSGGGAYAISALDINDVETVQIANFDTHAGDTTVDTALFSGVTTLGLSSSGDNGDTIFSNVAAVTDAAMSNGSGDLTLTYTAAAVVGTADVQNLAVSNLTAGGFTANGAETISITSSGVKSTMASVTSNALKTLNISGDQDLKITTAVDFAANGTTTAPGAVIDASSMTGKLTITTTASENLSLKSGSGDDSLTLGSLVATDVVDGGAGTDTITMDAGTFTTQFSKVSNVENLTLNDSGAAISIAANKLPADMNKITVTLKDDATGADNLASAITGMAGESVVITRADEDADVDGQIDVTLTNTTDTATDTANVQLLAIGANGDEAGDTDGDEYGMGILNVGNFETVNLTSSLNAAGTYGSGTANEIMTLTASSTTGVNIDGNANLTLGAIGGGKMTSLDASGLAAKLTATLAGDKVAVTMGQKDSTIGFGATLNNADSVTGGAGTKDAVTATVTGLTATTGKLTISDVESINLTTSGANTIDASGITGASTVLAVTDNVQTITNFDLGQTIQLGLVGDESATASEIDVTAADATGAADTLKVKVENTNGATTSIIDASAIETLDLEVIAAANGATLDLTTFEGDNIAIASKAGVTATAALALGTLHKNTESVTSTYADKVTVSFANATNAASFSGAGTDVQNVTGSGKGDTVTIGSTGAITHVVSGGVGTDTTNITAAATFVNAGSIDTENVNITITAGADVDISGGATYHAGVDNVTVLGGNSLSTHTTGKMNTALKTFDASGFGGNIVASVADDALDTTITFTGGALATDEVNVVTANAATTYALKSTGVEILRVDSNAAAATTVSVAAATGIKTIEVDQGAAVATQTFTVSGLTGTETIILKASDDATAGANEHILAATLTDATGSSDTITFKTGTGTIDAGARLQAADIETVTVNADNAADLDLTNFSMSAAAAVMGLTVTGDSALTISGLGADVTTVDASGMTVGGSIIQTGRSATGAVTVTGSAGNDTVMMNNKADVLDGGTATGDNDTLDINIAVVLGGINVDLSSATDQISTVNGMAETTAQTNFESVDLAGYTGGFGAQVTGSKVANTIVGSDAVDQIDGGAGNDNINGGDGADTITGGAGDDTINGGTGADADALTGGGGSDTFVFQAATANNGTDTISDFAVGATASGGDVLSFDPFLDASATVANGTSGGKFVSPTTSALAAQGTPVGFTNKALIIKTTLTAVDTAGEVAALTVTGQALDAVDLAVNKKGVLIFGENDGTTLIVYGVTNNGTAAIATGEVVKLATITATADAIDNFVAANLDLV